MRSDFEPKNLKKAKETLEKHLSAVKVYTNTNEVSKKEVFKELSLWEKVKKLFSR